MEHLKISVCVTIKNESKETVNALLDSLNSQTLKPDEIIVIDANDYDNCSRSKGRNIAIGKARNEIIAITDAGCVPHNNWLANLAIPLAHLGGARAHPRGVLTVVAGGYEMVTSNHFQETCKMFLGVSTKDMKSDFMPSARSMAFTKSIWKKAGGFLEKLGNTAEDTVFNLQLLKAGAKFVVAKNAIVDWQMPDSIFEFTRKIFNYAKGDAESGIWWHPVKKFQTHNIKILTIFLRYILFIIFPLLIPLYLIYAYTKAGLWGILLQFTSDFACIIGFSHGLLQTSFRRN